MSTSLAGERQADLGGKNIIGPAAYGISKVTGLPIDNGYYWNTYIYATIDDHSGLTRNWRWRQDIWVFKVGTFWNGTDPRSVVDKSEAPTYTGPNGESPDPPYRYRSADVLSWADSPAWDPNPMAKLGLKPYDYIIRANITSWLDLDGKMMCPKSWRLIIEWKKGQLTKWDVH